jgi:hypothetical protein
LYGLLHVLGAEQARSNWALIEQDWRRVNNDPRLSAADSHHRVNPVALGDYSPSPLYWPYYGEIRSSALFNLVLILVTLRQHCGVRDASRR